MGHANPKHAGMDKVTWGDHQQRKAKLTGGTPNSQAGKMRKVQRSGMGRRGKKRANMGFHKLSEGGCPTASDAVDGAGTAK